MGAAVEQDDAGRAGGGAAEAEAAGVAERVQHRRAGGQAGHAIAVLALVEEPAGLLPAEQVHGEAEPALLRPHRLRRRRPSSGRTSCASPSRPRTAASLRATTTRGASRPRKASSSSGVQPIHAGGVGLHGQRVAVAIDDQPWQPIRLGVDQAVEGRGVEALAQRQRAAPAVRASHAASMTAAGSRDRRRAAIRLCGLKCHTPCRTPSSPSRRTGAPGVSAFAAAVMAISLEKAQGWPAFTRRSRPGSRRSRGRSGPSGLGMEAAELAAVRPLRRNRPGSARILQVGTVTEL